MKNFQCLGSGLLLALSLLVGGAAQAQDIYFNPANAVGTGHVEAISFAAWSWSEHSGFAAQYVGTTALDCIDGAIVVQTASVQTWPYDITKYPEVLARSTACGKGGFMVQLRYDIGAAQEIVTHEIGHTLVNLPVVPFQNTHLADRFSLMYSAPKEVTAITYSDANAGVRFARWSLYHDPAYCYVELLPDNDLYLPYIGGSRAQLAYTGVVDGYHTWTLKSATKAVNTCTNTQLLPSGGAVLHDIRGQFSRYASAELEYVGNNTWRLLSVEE
jgi:hypothetical protein